MVKKVVQPTQMKNPAATVGAAANHIGFTAESLLRRRSNARLHAQVCACELPGSRSGVCFTQRRHKESNIKIHTRKHNGGIQPHLVQTTALIQRLHAQRRERDMN